MASDPSLVYYQSAADWLRAFILQSNGEMILKLVWQKPFWFGYNERNECVCRVEEASAAVPSRPLGTLCSSRWATDAFAR